MKIPHPIADGPSQNGRGTILPFPQLVPVSPHRQPCPRCGHTPPPFDPALSFVLDQLTLAEEALQAARRQVEAQVAL